MGRMGTRRWALVYACGLFCPLGVVTAGVPSPNPGAPVAVLPASPATVTENPVPVVGWPAPSETEVITLPPSRVGQCLGVNPVGPSPKAPEGEEEFTLQVAAPAEVAAATLAPVGTEEVGDPPPYGGKRPEGSGTPAAPTVNPGVLPVAEISFEESQESFQAAEPAAPTVSGGPPASFPRAEVAPGRRSFVDLTAAPCFGHAPDYRWIVGRVEYSQVAREWRLRYSSVDEVDRYGGRVSLIENNQVTYLADGMYVHVRGHLANPDAPENTPVHYRIEWFQAVENPNTFQLPPSP